MSAYKSVAAENMVVLAFAADGREPTLVECKSNNGRVTSMRYLVSHPKKYSIYLVVKFTDTNVGGGAGFVTLPLYALGFLPR